MKYRSRFVLAASMLVPFLLFEYIRLHPAIDVRLFLPKGHFYVVSSVAFLAVIVAIAVGLAGARLRNIQVTFLSLSFLSLAGVFAVHGLSTPDLLLQATHLPGVTAPLSIILATLWLWMSSLPSDNRWIQFLSRFRRYLLPFWTFLLVASGILAMLHPHLVDFLPLNIHPFNWAVAILTILLNVITQYRFYSSYLYSRFPLQKAIVYSSGWLIVAQLIMLLGKSWHLSWWLYHFLLLAATLMMLVGLVKQYAAKHSLTGAIRALFTTDPVERITNSLSPSVKELIIATEKKDIYTAGHNFRVTLYALKLAEEMRLRPEQLRAVAQGTIIHDVGKIHIPDAILNKPGKLTPEERAVIETHPVKGYEMCRGLGFMKEELEIIRGHHEKWDGTGYPDRLQGNQIPFLARIVAVADVYDALTSTRAYRQAMTHQEAMDFLSRSKGSHFDPECVEAWERVCERNPSFYPYPSDLTAEGTKKYLLSPA